MVVESMIILVEELENSEWGAKCVVVKSVIILVTLVGSIGCMVEVVERLPIIDCQ